jgi:hypothetical protein
MKRYRPVATIMNGDGVSTLYSSYYTNLESAKKQLTFLKFNVLDQRIDVYEDEIKVDTIKLKIGGKL